MIVARLIQFKKLGGFHFNDSKYGDDDLDAGAINPYQLFLVFNELVDAELPARPASTPAHMIDQSHNVTDPIESLMVSAMEIERAYVQAHLVDRAALAAYQEANDALMASETLEAGLPHRRRADPRHGASRQGRGDRAGRHLSRRRLPPEGRRRPAEDQRRRRRHRLNATLRPSRAQRWAGWLLRLARPGQA